MKETTPPKSCLSRTSSWTFLVIVGLCLILGPATAYAAFFIKEAEWETDESKLEVEGKAAAGAGVEISNADSHTVLGVVTADKKGKWKFKLRNPSVIPCRVAASTGSQVAVKTVEDAPGDCGAGNDPGIPVISAISVSGPNTVAENSGAQYTCTARYSDGSTEDVSISVAWTENSPYASVDGLGRLSTGIVSGEESVVLTARYGSLTDSLSVQIQNASSELVSLYISGPESVTEGQNARYGVTAVYTSGTSRELQDGVEWDISDPALASIDTKGILLAHEVDADQSANVRATFVEAGISHTATAAVIILNTGETVTGSHAGRFSTYEGTRTCLECHTDEAMEVHDSVHYQWKGDASEAVGLSTDQAGKLGGINDFCIYPDINWIGKLINVSGEPVDGGCAKCHVGLGAKPASESTREQLENIDCLVCHSDSYKRTVDRVDGQYRFVPDIDRMEVGILQAASDIARPSNDSCLDCHTKAGGGDNFKRGDIEEAHRNATRDFDVHLASKAGGGAGLRCLDCHSAASHRIAGRGADLRPRDTMDEVSCTNCHTAMPHGDKNLDKHTARVNCTVCHIPVFAKNAPTDMNRDWSRPGDLVESTGLYEPSHEKGQNVQPVYRFFNGSSAFYEFGAEAVAGPSGRIAMAQPIGDVNDPNAKIHAFKHHLGYQPIDPGTRRLLPLKIGKFFETGQIGNAVALGTEAVGWDYQGHEFAKTERYLGLFHEVAPKDQALTCSSCHGGNRLDFDALGYTPKETRNGRALCTSCHGNKSDEWEGSEYFYKVHKKHVKDKKYDCSECHSFKSAN